MSKHLDLFCQIPCLTEKSKQLNGIGLQKKWFKNADKRAIGQYLQKFISYNSHLLEFLDVQPFIIGSDKNTALIFRSSSYIGAIPLIAPDTGKQIGDLVVLPRFTGQNKFEEYIEILNLLDKEITPESIDSLPLASGSNFKPPLYLEAVNFITSLEKLTKKSWHKFNNIERWSNQPIGQINWNKYIQYEHKIEYRLTFPINKNVLSELHDEYSQLRYVFDIAKKEILSTRTPHRIKNSMRYRIKFLEERLYQLKPKITKNIVVNSSDSPTIKECKICANKILNFESKKSTAWRVDFSDVFEKFIQFVFKEITKEIGGHLHSNIRFGSETTNYYSWELKHLEPDAIYQKEDLLIFIDAKYKANMYNKSNTSELIAESFRHDLHQILAYSSFTDTNPKYSFLCYPSFRLEFKEIQYTNRINKVTNKVFLLGTPLIKSSINEIKRLLVNELDQIFYDHSLRQN